MSGFAVVETESTAFGVRLRGHYANSSLRNKLPFMTDDIQGYNEAAGVGGAVHADDLTSFQIAV